MKLRLILRICLIGIFLIPTISIAQDRDPNYSFKENVNDSVISSQIKAKLSAAEDLDYTGIKVDTDKNGKVTLSGSVRTEYDRNRANNIAHSIDGVKEVINRIEAINRY